MHSAYLYPFSLTRTAVDHHGRPIKNYEDWQQGVLIVLHFQENDPKYVLDTVHIQDGWAMFGGQEFIAS